MTIVHRARQVSRRLVPAAALVLLTWQRVDIDAQMPQALLDQEAHIAQLATEAAQRGPAAPIPLIGDNGRTFGVVYDQYLLGVVAGRAAIAGGRPADAAAIQQNQAWQSRGTVIVAYPIDCDGKPNRPMDIHWRVGMQLPIAPRTIAGPVRGNQAQAILPGIGLPDDALVVNLQNAAMINASVDVDYENPVCRAGSRTESLPLSTRPSTAAMTAFNGIKLPDALSALPSPSTVRIRVTLDAAGRARFPEQMQGPAELGPVAIAALEGRVFPPSTINGVPMPLGMLVPFVFTASGAPGQVAPFAPSAQPAAPGTMVASSTVAVPGPGPAPPASGPAVPPAPPGQTNTQFARLAIEVASKGEPVPIPLDAAGPAVHGVVFDSFLVAAVKARAAVDAGTPMNPANATPEMLAEDFVAVAFPVTCEGRTITPVDIKMSRGGTQPGVVRETSSVLTGGVVVTRLPGVRLPLGSIARTFASSSFSQSLEVRVTYASPACGSADTTLTLPIQWTRGLSLPHLGIAKLPAGAASPSPTSVAIRAMVDLDGAYRFPTLADGPPELAATAIVTAAQWKFQPYRANGVPVPQVVLSPLIFTTSGAPEPAQTGPPNATTAPPPGTGAPRVMTSTTINGRSTVDFTTADVAGLSEAKSQCEIATDAAYGIKPDSAISTGGGPMGGPAKELDYLRALRGPTGQGLHVVRLGTVSAADGKTILDLYELTYPGLPTPMRIVLDEYHEGPLKAVKGLVCAGPIGK